MNILSCLGYRKYYYKIFIYHGSRVYVSNQKKTTTENPQLFSISNTFVIVIPVFYWPKKKPASFKIGSLDLAAEMGYLAYLK